MTDKPKPKQPEKKRQPDDRKVEQQVFNVLDEELAMIRGMIEKLTAYENNHAK